MDDRSENRRRAEWPLILISVAVLLVCLGYAFARAFLTPNPGFTLSSEWLVTHVDPCKEHPGWCEANSDLLQINDQLLAVGDLTYEEYWRDRRLVPFGGYGVGDVVSITVRRDGGEQTIRWKIPPVTVAGRARPFSGLLFDLPFWAAGTAVLLFLRPRDRRWRLLVAFDYLTALWLATGMASTSSVAASSLLAHALSWLAVPVYVHLHMLVPTPLFRRHFRFVLVPLYAIACILAALELWQVLPSSLAYTLGMSSAIISSLALLISRLFGRSSRRAKQAAALMLTGIIVSFVPGLGVALIPTLLGWSAPGALATAIALLSVPALPAFYTYALYKRHLGTLEFRANRVLGAFSFFLLYGTGFALCFVLGSQGLDSAGGSLFFGLIVSIAAIIATPLLRARFQRFIDRLAYGTEHHPDDIIRTFADQIPAALDIEALGRLLKDKVAPSLLIRQSALYLAADTGGRLVYESGISADETAQVFWRCRGLLLDAGRYRPPLADQKEIGSPGTAEHSWVRLAVPLELRGQPMGIWLFGRRDPDDYYPQSDVALLVTLAGQVAVALENARLYQQADAELQVRARELATLCIVSERMSRSLNPDEVLHLALDCSIEVAGMDCGGIFLLDPSTEELYLSAHVGVTPALVTASDRLGANGGLMPRMLETTIVIDDLSKVTGNQRAAIEHEGLQSLVSIPLKVEENSLGVMIVAGHSPRTFRPEELALLAAIGNQVAVAIDRANLQAQELRVAVLEERQAMSRQIHDDIAQTLGYLGLQIDGVMDEPTVAHNVAVQVSLETIRGAIEDAYARVRSAILQLREDIPSNMHFESALHEVIRDFEDRTGCTVEAKVDKSRLPDLSPPVALQTYHIIGEALNNIRKHSQADSIRVILGDTDDGMLGVTIQDNGQGFDLERHQEMRGNGFGLQFMRERAERVGGRLNVDSQPGRGTRIVVKVPTR